MFKIDFHKPVQIHFIGIGGISMSSLAEILLHKGFSVSGSDNQESTLTQRLTRLGATIFLGQSPDHIGPETKLVIYTAAISSNNPELLQAKKMNLPTLSRAELLGQMMDCYQNSIAVAGTHGKTTTTSMISQILIEANADPTISIGGILNLINDNTRIGNSDLFVIESCEYTNSFYHFYPKYSVILNIEEDHLDFFKDLEDIRNSFRHYLGNTKKDGLIFLNSEIERLEELTISTDASIITFGFQDTDTYQAKDIQFGSTSTRFQLWINGEYQETFDLSLLGMHNVSNALAAIACTHTIGTSLSDIAYSLSHCQGARRRFEHKGTFQGATIIDDYAHHPTEIKAALSAARELKPSRLICVFQPHTYTRTAAFMNDFATVLSDADVVILPDIFAARETDDLGVSSADLCQALTNKGTQAFYFPSFEEIESFLKKNCINGDLLITMGAGNVVNIGEHLLKE